MRSTRFFVLRCMGEKQKPCEEHLIIPKLLPNSQRFKNTPGLGVAAARLVRGVAALNARAWEAVRGQ